MDKKEFLRKINCSNTERKSVEQWIEDFKEGKYSFYLSRIDNTNKHIFQVSLSGVYFSSDEEKIFINEMNNFLNDIGGLKDGARIVLIENNHY